MPKETKFYKTKLCPWHVSGSCRLGDRCSWAHSTAEVRAAVDLTKTKLCPTIAANQRCQDKNCRYAHTRAELRATSDVFKTSLCTFWMKGGCFLGSRCRYAHGISDLRPTPEKQRGGSDNNGSPRIFHPAVPKKEPSAKWARPKEEAVATALRRTRSISGPQGSPRILRPWPAPPIHPLSLPVSQPAPPTSHPSAFSDRLTVALESLAFLLGGEGSEADSQYMIHNLLLEKVLTCHPNASDHNEPLLHANPAKTLGALSEDRLKEMSNGAPNELPRFDYDLESRRLNPGLGYLTPVGNCDTRVLEDVSDASTSLFTPTQYSDCTRCTTKQ